MKIKRVLSVILAFVLVLSTFAGTLTALADEPVYFLRGVLTDGTNTAYWIIDKDNKALYLSGDGVTNGRTPDYPSASEGPFAGRKDVTRIVIEEDVEYVGAYVFANMTSVDTIEIQSNLLKRDNSINSNAFSGDLNIRNVQGDSEVLSTNTLLSAVKVGIGIASSDWVSVVKNLISTGSDVANGDGSLDDESVDAMVNDYIMTGETVYLGEMEDVIDGYEDRMANPCYTNNAFHHNYTDAVTEQPTCTEEGVDTFTCTGCGDTYDVEIPALGHNYEEEVYLAPTCTKRGVMDKYCTVCGTSSFEAIPATGHTSTTVPKVEPTCTTVGYKAWSYCSVCGETLVPTQEIDIIPHSYGYYYSSSDDSYTAICDGCSKTITEFTNDTDALISAEAWAGTLNEEDYTAESFAALEDATELHKDLTADDTLQYPQFAVDAETTEILTKIASLKAYLNLETSGDNGTVTCTYDGNTVGKGTHKLVFGESLTFTAVPDAGYKFIAWYDEDTLSYLSTDAEFTYKITANLKLKAIFAPSNYVLLTFKGEGGQIKALYFKSEEEWEEYDDIDELLPPVPYKYGYTNGRWVYNSRIALDLSIGVSHVVTAEYDEVDVPVPNLPLLRSAEVPALSLTYYYNNTDNLSVGTLVMASNLPQGCNIESIGIAYIKDKADTFNPADINLTITSKVKTARFEGLSDSGLYILNIRNLSSKSNWAVKGYMTYYDSEGNLRTSYTNQINIVDKQQV